MACINRSPDITSASLFAKSTLLPACAAANAGSRPAAPTIAAITVSQPDSVTAVTKACGPYRTCVWIFFSSNRVLKRAAAAASVTTAMAGLNSTHCSANRSTCFPAVRATTLKRSGCARITSSVFTPIDPVDPKMATCLIGIRPSLPAVPQWASLESMHPRGLIRRHVRVINGCCLLRQPNVLTETQRDPQRY